MTSRRRVTAVVIAILGGACTEMQTPAGPGPYTPNGSASASSAPEVLSGAGNIGTCSNNTDEATAKLLDALPGTVFAAGDNAFPHGSSSDYQNCYGTSWGRHFSR